MGSLRTLFLSVYASNSVIRTLFLPLCYTTLFSPFILALAWYFGFGQTLQNSIPEDFSWFDLLPAFAISAVFVLLPTRLLSSPGTVTKSQDGKRRVQSLPYWIPGVRHLSSIAFGGEEWLASIRDSATASIVAYKAAGTKHNVLLSEPLLDQLYNHWNNLDQTDSNQPAILRNAFSLPKVMESHYLELQNEINQVVKTELYDEAARDNLIKASLRILTESLPDLVTFNSSIVDQMQWERVSNVELTDGTSEAECDLFTLLNEFCCNAILPPIVGAQFTESYQLLATDLASCNERFWALALGLPRLAPIQGLPGAALARKRLLRNFAKQFEDLSNPPVRRVPDDDESVSGEEDTDADVVTPLMKLNELFTKHELPAELRASIGLHVVHDIYSEVMPIVFWTVIHIYSSSKAESAKAPQDSPLERIKAESKTWAQAIQPPSIHPSFPAPPEIRYGSVKEVLTPNSLSYLRSCINEARRLYNCSISTYKVQKSLHLKDDTEQWELEAGSYVDVGLSRSLINSSPTHHISPRTFKPDRFVDIPASSSIVSATDISQSYKTNLIISIASGITQLWEISPAPKKSFFDHIQEAGNEASFGAEAPTAEQKAAREEASREKEDAKRKDAKWVLPKAVDGAGIKVPKGDIRVRIRRREGLPASKVVRRIG
ncbi:hypothetical protein J4E93_008341 [Alternaria ventricosa]|uniref:uncharacterized protein n=1 Tax=Alternaria ventricosa TaxID=1187951 RepID=UPI0020C43168|nr:uncharacterized protein J4E93_008341 [Alternaria ventricosa]KAI4640749.1 hypothetical protein J4E93_008341 [Alternaria ventricosa]